jgi:hypothetical protein
MRLNYPHFDPAKPKPQKEVRCFDGEAGCDLDNTVNNECVFDVDICLRNTDPSLPSCTPADVDAVSIGRTSKFPELQSLQTAANALLPATTNVCTTGQGLTVPLKEANGVFKVGKGGIKLTAAAGSVSDKDRVKFTCVPANWPAHGYNAANHRSTPLAVAIDTSNVDDLVIKWHFATFDGGSNGVTSTPTVDAKRVYVTSWNGRVYALDRKTGGVKWVYDTESQSQLGIQSSATLTADGRLLVGDSLGTVD